MKNSERILIYQQNFFLSYFLNQNPKSTIVLFKIKKIKFFKKIFKKCSIVMKHSEKILIFHQKFLLS